MKTLHHYNGSNCYHVTDVDLSRSSDIITIIGSGECVKNDISVYNVHGDVMAINYIAMFLDITCKHVVSLHVELIDQISNFRRFNTSDNSFITHKVGLLKESVKHFDSKIDCIWKFNSQPMFSGLAGIFIAIALGYEKILLLGMPFNKQRRFTDLLLEEKKSNDYMNCFINTVGHELKEHKHKIRSASGESAIMYGYPTELWLNI